MLGPFIIPRIEKISVSADAFELALTKQIAEQGAPATAQLLNHSDLARLTEAYGVIRATQNEQYHGLRLAEKYWSRLDQAERATIRSLTSAADFGGGQTARRVVADRLLTK
ncbi:hypothetical protein [Winogradskya consettensis]|uniref:hypothetical protein n=1 Tax=Winogradskya consettensis TaxID=113560 RepID=UPI001BB37050|nr:hypothetical protein [Actinoplanes consettensis]